LTSPDGGINVVEGFNRVVKYFDVTTGSSGGLNAAAEPERQGNREKG